MPWRSITSYERRPTRTGSTAAKNGLGWWPRVASHPPGPVAGISDQPEAHPDTVAYRLIPSPARFDGVGSTAISSSPIRRPCRDARKRSGGRPRQTAAVRNKWIGCSMKLDHRYRSAVCSLQCVDQLRNESDILHQTGFRLGSCVRQTGNRGRSERGAIRVANG